MNYQVGIATAGGALEAARQAQNQRIMDALKVRQAQDTDAAAGVFGRSFPGAVGAGGTPPMVPVPSGTSLPWQRPGMDAGTPPFVNNPSPAPGGITTPPFVARPSTPPGMGVPASLPTATVLPGGEGGMPHGQLTWQQIADAIKKEAPDASGQVIAGVIDKYTPLMTQQSKTDWYMMKAMLDQQKISNLEDYRDKSLGLRETLANKADATRQRGQDLTRDYRTENMSQKGQFHEDLQNWRNMTMEQRKATFAGMPAEQQMQFRALNTQYTQAEAGLRSAINMGNPKQVEQARGEVASARAAYDDFIKGAASTDASGAPAAAAEGTESKPVVLKGKDGQPVGGKKKPAAAAPVMGTQDNPIVATTQADIDNAPAGAFLNINGQLMQK